MSQCATFRNDENALCSNEFIRYVTNRFRNDENALCSNEFIRYVTNRFVT
jgi:hypothetical protein